MKQALLTTTIVLTTLTASPLWAQERELTGTVGSDESPGGYPGAGAYSQIRGQNTINGSAQPLLIVDGVPVSNASDNLGPGTASGNGIVQQSRINDLNPEDIERMEVLKGASAAALWGTRAANGVIIITTKKGSDTKGKVNITVKSTVSFDRVNKMPALQRSYGQGSGGFYL